MPNQLARFAPENGVQIFDVAIGEGGHEILSLLLVLVALGEQDAHAQDAGQAFAEVAWFDELMFAPVSYAITPVAKKGRKT